MDSNLPKTYVKDFNDEQEVKKMFYAPLGTTDLKLSKLGVGGGTLGHCYGTIDDQEGISLVREALIKGVNYIDTSPYYGHTSSETLIGKALVQVPREAFHISTKVGRYGTTWADFFDHSAERIVNEFEKSLERLGLDYVDIVFVHDIEFSPLQQILTESLPAVKTLVEKKKARYIGVSGYPLSVLWETVEKSPVKIDVVLSYARDCLFDFSMRAYANFFQAHNVALVNASLTGMGLLTNQGPPNWHPASQKIKDMCHKASVFCQDEGVELGKLAVYDAMQRPYFSSHLVGMKTLSELRCNLDLATKGLNSQEKQVLNQVKLKFFNSGENFHWEGVEIEEMKKYRDTNKH